ncbi:MAG: soxS [Planctomycetaceae bacterium]|nr:soxS [Planctomycetaceae bacterium]
MNSVTYTAADVRFEHQPPRRMAYIRVIGPYNHETFGPAFGRVIRWASEHGAMNANTVCLGVYYDDPEIIPPEEQRADVGVTVDENFQPSGEVQVQTIAGGLCAILRHKGHYNTLGDAYRWLYGVWLPESSRKPCAAPPYEVYINDASKLPPEEWLTDICIPLAG